MAELGFGIIGCGGISSTHVGAIENAPGARLVAVCDIVPERAQALGEKAGVEWYTDYAQMLKRRDVEVVNVCTPSGLHARHAIQAVQAGKHVITEKPIDISLRRIDELLAEVEKAGVKLACIFQYRFHPVSRRIKQEIDEGRFGRIIFANASVRWYRKQSYYDSGDWRGTWALDGGVLSNQAIHAIDQLTWFMGDLDRVEWADLGTLERRIEAEVWGQAIVRYKNGVAANIQATTLTAPGFDAIVEVYGTKGGVVLADGGTVLTYKVEGEETVIERGEGASKAGTSLSSDPLANSLTGHSAEVDDFVSAVRDDRPPYVTGQEARKAVAVLTEIYRQAFGYNPFER